MSRFRRAGAERINVFRVGERYLFRHYFEGEEVFETLSPYYDNQHYRFAVPAEDLDDLRPFLGERGYDLVVVDPVEEFVVVKRQYTAHPENIFKAAVYHWSSKGYNCFLLKDRESVERAVEQGAVPFVDTDMELPF